MIYLFCPKCKTTREARVSSSVYGKDVARCKVCGEEVSSYTRKECRVCGDVLYAPKGHESASLPCAGRHTAAETSRAAEPVRPEPARWEPARPEPVRPEPVRPEPSAKSLSDFRDLLEVACPNHPAQRLRKRDGRFEKCPVCGYEPTEGYLEYARRAQSGEEPQLIHWNDMSGREMAHVWDCAENPPYSVVLVEQGQHVVYDADGRRRFLMPKRYALFNNNYTDEQKMMMVNEAQEGDYIDLGLGGRIIFFSSNRFIIEEQVERKIGKAWFARIPIEIHARIASENVQNLMDVSIDWTDNRKVTEALQERVKKTVQNNFGMLLMSHRRDAAIETFEEDEDVLEWLSMILDEDTLLDLRDQINESLTARFGIEIENLDIRFTETEVSALPQ